MAGFRSSITSRSITTCLIFESGASNIGSSKSDSYGLPLVSVMIIQHRPNKILTTIRLSPRAPVCFSDALRAISSSAASVKWSPISLKPNKAWYCRIREFLGSVNTRIMSLIVRFLTEAMTGKRPTNSGMRPYLIRSVGRGFIFRWPGLTNTVHYANRCGRILTNWFNLVQNIGHILSRNLAIFAAFDRSIKSNRLVKTQKD
jgi:hypothetical protein